MQHRSGDETCVRAGQVGNGGGDFRSLSEPLEWCGLRHALIWSIRALVTLGSGDRRAAGQHLDATVAAAGERGLPFIGPQLYAARGRLETDPAALRQTLATDETMLAQSALSLNYFVFYGAGIQTWVDRGDWAAAERYCTLLETYAAAEPFSWADFVLARGRALCRCGRGETGAALVATLQALHRQAAESESNLYLPAIEAALQRLGVAV